MALFLTASEIATIQGITPRAVRKRAQREKWKNKSVPVSNGGPGPEGNHYDIASLPGELQAQIIETCPDVSNLDLLRSDLAPEAKTAAMRRLMPSLLLSFSEVVTAKPKKKSFEGVVWNQKVAQRVLIAEEALSAPPGYTKRQWMGLIANKYSVSRATVYRWLERYSKDGLAGLNDARKTKDTPKKWSSDALYFWIGLCLKREHRKIDRKRLYHDILVPEARRRGWDIGTYNSACGWFSKRVTPQLLALQHGGPRALDNTLPPVLRDYSDLEPLEIVVGDQHRFDRWVIDEETGELFRPEGYIWIDLRTRMVYGGAVGKKYDAQLMGQALWFGCKATGVFRDVYVDNGSSELSNQIGNILDQVRDIHLSVRETLDAPLKIDDIEPDDLTCSIDLPGKRRRAIVRNAKAKLIEGFFKVLENIHCSVFRAPGTTKRLADLGENQEVDEKEIRKLAEQGKLLTWSEFVLLFYKSLDYYNQQRPHRGVLREWKWKPRPKSATPADCLMECYRDGWRPVRVSDEALSLMFMFRAERTVDRGRIEFQTLKYEHEALAPLNGQKVDIRYDPLDPEEILVFQGKTYICAATPVEFSSMRDRDLASRKIRQKRRMHKAWREEYKRLTRGVGDFMEYGKIPPLERAAALVGRDRRRRAAEQEELYRERTPKELAAETAQVKDYRPVERKTPPPVKHSFNSPPERYAYLLDVLEAVGELPPHDWEFMAEFEEGWGPGVERYWTIQKKTRGVADLVAAGIRNPLN